MKQVGVREFRDHATLYLSGSDPIAVSKHDRIIGVYVPLKRDEEKIRRAWERFGQTIDRILQETGMSEDELADIVQAEKPDFLQINYSVTQRAAEKRVFPLARDLGVAVLANRNFDDGALFAKVAGKDVPAWATEAGITSWAQLFLKFALSEPAVTVVIPATGKPDRQSDNLKAGIGPMLDRKQRDLLIAAVA